MTTELMTFAPSELEIMVVFRWRLTLPLSGTVPGSNSLHTGCVHFVRSLLSFWVSLLTLMPDVQALQHNMLSFKLVVFQSALTCCRVSLSPKVTRLYFSQLKQRQPVYMDGVDLPVWASGVQVGH